MAENTTPNGALTRWLLLTLGGVVLVIAGLMWDAAQHSADPDLASHEGPLTLTNPSHATAAAGLAAVVVGLAGALWTMWRPSLTTVRAKVLAAGGGAIAATVVLVGGAWAVTSGEAAHDHGHSHAATTAPETATRTDDGSGHQHPSLAPYADRYAAASGDERTAADDLLAQTRATLARYADVATAVSDGYVAPVDPKGPLQHYRNPALVRDGDVLDPSRPEGLVYYTAEGHAPVLLGAFFVAPPGTPVPSPAGDLVVWHSHSPACPGFFATDDEPCTDTVRMLHVWTRSGVELVRRTGDTVSVTITDPFGAPFRASVARAG